MEILDFINSYWSVLLFIGTVIVSWVRYEAVNKAQDMRIEDLEKQQLKMESKMDTNDKIITSLKVDIAEIKTILQFLKDKFDK